VTCLWQAGRNPDGDGDGGNRTRVREPLTP
jgi:hypothetical protein